MLEFTRTQGRLITDSVARFEEEFRRDVAGVLDKELRGAQPKAVTELLESLTLITRQLELKGKNCSLHELHAPLLKRVLIDQRRFTAKEIELPLQRASEPEVVRHLQRRLVPIESLMEQPWFEETQALRVPRLSDFLSVRFAEKLLPTQANLQERVLDEKFHILEAPSLFLPDLDYYRARCNTRGLSLCVAYLDIDDFKAYNTKLSETKVDLQILLPFMEALEAQVFACGHAYRFGGDEYVILLPNATGPEGIEFMRRLQKRLASIRYLTSEKNPTVSIGVCIVEPDCMLTDREILARANLAKSKAKETRKGSIAHYRTEMFRQDELLVEEEG